MPLTNTQISQLQRAHSEHIHARADRLQRTALGLELAQHYAHRGRPMTCYEISVWCGCTPEAIARIERQAIKKLRLASRLLLLKSL